jgi:hypothetical protein
MLLTICVDTTKEEFMEVHLIKGVETLSPFREETFTLTHPVCIQDMGNGVNWDNHEQIVKN